ncbi:hypothetical protein TrVGV298_003181 [Trichoderma virens]|nr:hypothetical protein TrVGV298_003181 [Trichoderma virens]
MNLLLSDDYLLQDYPESMTSTIRSGHATMLRFNRKGDYLASGRVDGTVVVWDLETMGVALKMRGAQQEHHIPKLVEMRAVSAIDMPRLEGHTLGSGDWAATSNLFVASLFEEQPLLVDVSEPVDVKRVLPSAPKRSNADSDLALKEKQAKEDAKQMTTSAIWTALAETYCATGEYVAASTYNNHELYVWERNHGSLVCMLKDPKEEQGVIEWHPSRPLLAACGLETGRIYIWSVISPQKWSALAPDFAEVEENVEYMEREDEFDIYAQEEIHRRRLDAEDEDVDVLTADHTKEGDDLENFRMPILFNLGESDSEDEFVAVSTGTMRRRSPGESQADLSAGAESAAPVRKKGGAGARGRTKHQAPHVQNFQASSDRLASTTTKLCPRFKVITKRVGHRLWHLEAPRKRRYKPPTCDLRVDTAPELVATGETCREVLLGLVARTGDRESAISQQLTTASAIDSSTSRDKKLSSLGISSVFLRALHQYRDCEARAASAALTDPFQLP